MPREIELKFRVDDSADLRAALRRAGVAWQAARFEINRMFDTPAGDLRRRDCGLRLRTAWELPTGPAGHASPPAPQATLTYKGPRDGGAVKSREEIETAVGDADALAAALDRLGYRETVRYEKLRDTARCGECVICLDTLPRLGCYAEIEGPTADAVGAMADRLGLDPARGVRVTYVELAAEHGEITRHGVRVLRFERPSPLDTHRIQARDGWGRRLAEREEMISSQLVARGIHAPAVLRAMRLLPREWFLPDAVASQAYHDSALPVDCDQTISQPYMVARMTELLELTPDDRVLEIGTGTGYQTAILALLAERVYSVERHAALLAGARRRLEWLGLDRVSLHCGDGSQGWPEHALFDAILVTAGAPAIPASLEGQLALGGRLVIPVGDPDSQMLVRLVRTPKGIRRQELLACRFVRLVGREGWRE